MVTINVRHVSASFIGTGHARGRCPSAPGRLAPDVGLRRAGDHFRAGTVIARSWSGWFANHWRVSVIARTRSTSGSRAREQETVRRIDGRPQILRQRLHQVGHH